MEELDGGDVVLLKEVPAEEAVGRRDDTAEAKASGMLAAGVLMGGPSWSSSPSSSALTSTSA
jgi:hypothetical protein